MSTVDLIRHVKLSTARLPLAVPISDAKVFTGRQKPMTEVIFLFAEMAGGKGLHHQEGVMSHQRAPGFGDDSGMRNAGVGAGDGHRIDHVGGVFAQAVIGRGGEIGVRAIVVHGQP
ncbi:MAG: hypothetical protein ACK4K6_15250, partial [Pseudarthrobacter sp.]